MLCTPAAAALLALGGTATPSGGSTVAASALHADVLLTSAMYGYTKHLACAGGSQSSLEVDKVQDCYERSKAHHATLRRLQETHLYREAALLLTFT